MIGGWGDTNKDNDRYIPAFGGDESSTEATASVPVPRAGTVGNLRVKLSADPGTSPDEYIFTIMKNGSATGVTCTIQADNTSCSDTTNTVAFSAGDTISLWADPNNGPSASPEVRWSVTFS